MTKDSTRQKLETAAALIAECLLELGSGAREGLPKVLAKKDTPTPDLNLSIVNKIGDCDETEVIQKKILDTRGAEGRVLLAFYISYKYFGNEWLSSGDIEKITSDLGVKIDKKNVSNYLAALRKYLESGAARKKGQPTPYRMNRNGVKRFEEILHG